MSFTVTFDPAEPNVPLYTDVHCTRCKKQPPVQAGMTTPRWLQYDNVLPLTMLGGYGMFTDPMDDLPGNQTRGLNPETTILLCHECAHEFAAWVGLDASGWHTHVPADLGGTQHADHHHRTETET